MDCEVKSPITHSCCVSGGARVILLQGKKKGKKEAVQAVEDQRVEASSPVAPQAEAEPPLTISDAEVHTCVYMTS